MHQVELLLISLCSQWKACGRVKRGGSLGPGTLVIQTEQETAKANGRLFCLRGSKVLGEGWPAFNRFCKVPVVWQTFHISLTQASIPAKDHKLILSNLATCVSSVRLPQSEP